MNGDFVPRDYIASYHEREMDLALRLADQTQQRAQAIASTLTIVISVIGVFLAAKPSFLREFSDPVLRLAAYGSVGLLIISLGVSLAVAMPRNIALTDPQWFVDVYKQRATYMPLDSVEATDFVSTQQLLDDTYAEAYNTLLKSNRFRGLLLVVSGVLLIGGLWLGVYVAIRLSQHH